MMRSSEKDENTGEISFRRFEFSRVLILAIVYLFAISAHLSLPCCRSVARADFLAKLCTQHAADPAQRSTVSFCLKCSGKKCRSKALQIFVLFMCESIPKRHFIAFLVIYESE